MAQTQDGHALWAVRVTTRDTNYGRRKWHYQWSIVHVSEDEIKLYYAKCYRDNLAGSIKLPPEPALTRDVLPDTLLFSSEVKCMCGRMPYPPEAVELRENTLRTLIEIILDKQRTMPVLLITCPDVLSPEFILDMVLGNMVVYWCEDPGWVGQLNSALPRELYTRWDTIRIIMPLSEGKAYHQTYSYEDIRTIGADSFVKGLHRAFCQSLRGKERHAFLTVEDVESCRNRGQLIELTNRCNSLKNDLDNTTKRLAKQTEDLQSVKEQLYEIQKSQDVTEYEALLNTCISENDNLRRGISALSTRLYTTMGINFQPDENEPVALLQELSHAIYSALACAGSRK